MFKNFPNGKADHTAYKNNSRPLFFFTEGKNRSNQEISRRAEAQWEQDGSTIHGRTRASRKRKSASCTRIQDHLETELRLEAG